MTACPERVWQIGPEGLSYEGIVVSFQRFRRPAQTTVDKAPASCGVLPVAPGRNSLLLAVPREEAFWIGVLIQVSLSSALEITAELSDHTMISLARFTRAGAFTIDGIPRPDGQFDIFCADTIRRVLLGFGSGITRIDVASVEEFVAQTGRPPPAPFNANAAYQGWRLP